MLILKMNNKQRVHFAILVINVQHKHRSVWVYKTIQAQSQHGSTQRHNKLQAVAPSYLESPLGSNGGSHALPNKVAHLDTPTSCRQRSLSLEITSSLLKLMGSCCFVAGSVNATFCSFMKVQLLIYSLRVICKN